MSEPLNLGFVPLCDAAGLIVAKAKGFFAAEDLAVELSREASWATIRDKVAIGALDGAHMLAPMVLAQTLGVGSEATAMIAPLTLATGASAVTVSSRLGLGADPQAKKLAALVAERRELGASRLTFSVVFPFSTHNYLLRAWMAQAGIDPDEDVRVTISPPPRMAALLAGGVIEGFCAGEPWNAMAVTQRAGVVAVRADEIAPGAPDKVFATTHAWSQAHPETMQAILRALLRALSWAEAPENRQELVELLSRPEHLDVPADVVAIGLSHVAFIRNGASRPQPDQALWLLDQMRRWGQVTPEANVERAIAAYRADLYDQAALALA